MKIVHHNKDWREDKFDLPAEAKAKETGGDWAAAAEIYQRLIRRHPLTEKYYDRLMIVYRKMKQPRKELEAIDAGIRAFQNLYTRQTKSSGAKVISLSRALQKATGLVDKNGNSLYEPEPLPKWKKRRLSVEKILKKKS